MNRPWLALVESNTTGSGRRFCAVARDRGLRPVVLTTEPARYPYLRSDDVAHLVVPTSDRDAVRRACVELAGARGHGLAGVTSSSEYYVATAAAVAAELGHHGPDAAAVAVCRDKELQRRVLAAAGVAVPDFRLVTTVGGAVRAATDLRLPVVVKPPLGSGSVGVRRCDTAEEVAAAAGALLAAGHDERGNPVPARVLVEEYVVGAEYSVETFDHQLVGITGKHLGPEPHFVEVGHDFPAPLDADRAGAVARTARAALTALGLGWGAAHTELRLGRSGPVVIEVNPRLAGGMIPALVQEATGVDLVDHCVRAASGQRPGRVPAPRAAAAIRFVLAPSAGVVTDLRGRAAAAALPGVRAVELTVAPGDRIPELTHSFRDRLGYVVARGPDVDIASARAEAALRRIDVELQVVSSAVC